MPRGVGDPIQAVADCLRETFPLDRQLRLARQPKEQQHPELFFQRFDALADSTLREAEFPAGAGETLMAGDGLEDYQGADRGQA